MKAKTTAEGERTAAGHCLMLERSLLSIRRSAGEQHEIPRPQRVNRSISIPCRSTSSTVRRLRWSCWKWTVSGLRASWIKATIGFALRTCSRKTIRPSGLTTRTASSMAAIWFGIVQRQRLNTTASKT